MKARGPGAELVLMTNAVPAGLADADLAVFSDVWLCERAGMAARLVREGCDLAVLDTLQLPGFEAYTGPAALILRETPEAKLDGFRRPGDRPWDRVIVPNPARDWRPGVDRDFALSVDHAGWILRRTGVRGASPSSGIVLATGGGGTAQTRALLYPLLDAVVGEARRLSARSFTLRHALGPRAGGEALAEADAHFDPGAELNEIFRRADLVISTAGYNSVLEIAGTDTPALLVGIPRSLDDQMARVRIWGPRLGFGLDPDRPEEAAAWLADQIDRPRRRPPVELGEGGADRAAALLLEMLCPVS